MRKGDIKSRFVFSVKHNVDTMFLFYALILTVLLLQSVEAENGSLLSTCLPPKVPANARVVGKLGNLTIGSTVKILCNEGFLRRGRPKRITCLTNGQWSNFTLSCVGKRCGDPGSPVNGERIGWLFQYRSNVHFKCFKGYVLEGPKTRTCLSNQTWSERQPICKPVSCEKPPKVVGAMMESTTSFVYKTQLHYMCREGYQMQGSPTLTCGANGKWIGEIPVCKATVCKDPGTPLHGSRNGSKVFSYKAKLSFQCNKGFILYGAHERTCNDDGKWTGPQPYCVECAGVDTPVFIRKGFQFTHGLVKAKKGNVVTVLTEPDDEEEDVLILGRGTQHYAIVEDKVPFPAHVFIGTRVIAKQLDTEIFAFAEVVRITEDDKYFVTFQDNKRQSALTTIDFIRLLYPPTFCATCPDPEGPYNGFRLDSVEEFIPGTEVSYGCEVKTKLIGSDKRKCLPSGVWTGEQPRCQDLCYIQKCEIWKKCVYNNSGNNTECKCRENRECLRKYQPICGSDAKTYNNECIMKATACREKRSIKKIANGRCSPAAICQIIPKSVCRGYFRNFYFNTTTKRCEEIIAGGCHPSGWNGFTTIKECNRTCSVNICVQPVDPGPCLANESRWAFNQKAGRCKRFVYGGCFGNENNFDSKRKCNQRCPQTVPAKRKKVCPICPMIKAQEACKESAFALIGKVERRLSNDPTTRHLRYRVSIRNVSMNNANGSLPVRSAVIRVPYVRAPACSCSFPKLWFILVGDVPNISLIESSESITELNLTVERPSFVQRFNKDFSERRQKNCVQYFTDSGTAE
ncbi:zona pellucida sperm-binding protein 3 receptor-like isoform X1 [Montipora capricornis]|uniref:zona pellucida sperm-binding protein 3 receptor-like isoform X1 n=1 Tax=Montipora capricornis TaxID=246305 RepID=UPI0035F0FFA6